MDCSVTIQIPQLPQEITESIGFRQTISTDLEEYLMFKKLSLSTMLILFASSLTIGCATKALGVKADSSFTFSAITDGKMAVGGVVSLSASSEGDETSFANLLRTQLLEQREQYTVNPAGAVANKVGNDEYKKMLDNYRNNGALSDAEIKTLGSKLQGTRYVIFSRIESDDTTRNRSENVTKDKNGKTTGRKIKSETKRDVMASFNVYDLSKGTSAWSGTMKTSDKKNKTYDVSSLDTIVDLVSVVKNGQAKSSDDKYPFPEPPALNDLLSDIFKGFAKELPKK